MVLADANNLVPAEAVRRCAAGRPATAKFPWWLKLCGIRNRLSAIAFLEALGESPPANGWESVPFVDLRLRVNTLGLEKLALDRLPDAPFPAVEDACAFISSSLAPPANAAPAAPPVAAVADPGEGGGDAIRRAALLQGQKELRESASSGNLAAVNAVLGMTGLNVDVVDESGNTALIRAAQRGHVAVCTALRSVRGGGRGG